MKKKFHDTHGAAKYLAGDEKPLKTNTLEGWRVQGRGPKFYRIGGLIRYDEADLDSWLEQQAVTSTSQT
jgi:hypothetical protein